MKLIRVGAASVNQTPLDWEGNTDRIVEIILEAKQAGITLLCLPELSLTGYGCEDAFHSPDVQQRALKYLWEVCNRTFSETKDMIVCVGLPIVYRNALYNTMAVISKGTVLGFVAKQHLAGDGLHYEPRWFKPWPSGHIGHVSSNGWEMIPIGDIQFDFNGIRVGFEICEDAWVAERPGSRLACKGVDIILCPSASHFAFGKSKIREGFVTEGSRAFSVTYVYSNLLGNEAGRAIYDGECLIATGGNLVAQGPKFSYKAHELVSAVVDVDNTRLQQIRSSSFSPSHSDTPSKGWQTANGIRLLPNETQVTTLKEATEPEDVYGAFTSAVALGLFDYLRKSHSKGFVISLSGGADSAACAYLVRTMVSRVYKTYGKEGSSHLGLPSGISPSEATKRLLTCVYQRTRNSSKITESAAECVARDINAKFLSIDVDAIVNAYTKLVSDALGRGLSWDSDDIALQNIQARTRAPSAWMIANLEGKLLITTSNRSEAAVGYCTMDGDTAGSLAPIGGIDKAFLLTWLEYIKDVYPSISSYILIQQPTAELRPGSTQTDEKDLMPYPILEFIEDRAILEKKSPLEVYHCLSGASIGRDLGKEVLVQYVTKFFTKWAANQWKRERYAPSFHVDDKNLDPRSWCRFPILSSGFQVELAELRKKVIEG